LVELKQDGGSVSVERAQSSKSNRTRQRRISSLRKGVQDVKRKAEHLVDRLKSTNYWSYDKIFWYISLVLAIIGIIVYPGNGLVIINYHSLVTTSFRLQINFVFNSK